MHPIKDSAPPEPEPEPEPPMMHPNDGHSKRTRAPPNWSPAQWLGVALIALLLPAARAIKLSVSIPELVKLNDPFWLNCSLAGQQNQRPLELSSAPHQNRGPSAKQANHLKDIYAIKWYKDGEEFYKFLPNSSPQVSIYETNGVQLDRTRSHEGNVLVVKADINSEGNYRCEILSEAPLFETVRKSKHVKVYALPVRGPRIELLDQSGKPKNFKTQDISYGVGDLIELRCNSAPSKPAARLRWYLNDHELQMPAQNATTRRRRRAAATNQHHHYKLGPIEQKLHFKSIYSSHTTLSLVLQQSDLINSKISFKCVAAMKLEVPVVSKQLIVVMASSGAGDGPRARRQLDGFQFESPEPMMTHDARPHYQRAQQFRHSISRLPGGGSTAVGSHAGSSLAGRAGSMGGDKQEPISSDEVARRNQMLYIYEDADSALGSSIVDGQASLDKYSRQQQAAHNSSLEINGTRLIANYGSTATANYHESSRADNLELIQLLRESAGRQHKLSSVPSSSSSAALPQFAALKRANGINFLARPPLYLDELDQLRPVISWPPLESGRLLLESGSSNIVAIPTWMQQANSAAASVKAAAHRLESNFEQSHPSNAVRSIMLEKIFNNLNCTCTDANSDTQLEWLLDERPLDARDLRNYPNRAHASGEVRRQWSTIGFHAQNYSHGPQVSRAYPSAGGAASTVTLQSIFTRLAADSNGPNSLKPADGNYPLASNQIEPTIEDQLRVACQARHSVLVYSGSEMITFDFNPTPSRQQGGNSLNDKLASSSKNVIQATSASQSSSATRSAKPALLLNRSQATNLLNSVLMVIMVATSAYLYLPQRNHCYL